MLNMDGPSLYINFVSKIFVELVYAGKCMYSCIHAYKTRLIYYTAEFTELCTSCCVIVGRWLHQIMVEKCCICYTCSALCTLTSSCWVCSRSRWCRECGNQLSDIVKKHLPSVWPTCATILIYKMYNCIIIYMAVAKMSAKQKAGNSIHLWHDCKPNAQLPFFRVPLANYPGSD